MPRKLQVSITSNDSAFPASRMGTPAKDISSPAKPINRSGTCRPSLRPRKHAVAPSKPYDMAEESDRACGTHPMSVTTCATTDGQASAVVVVRELAPRQVRAAVMLVEGRLGKDVAAAIGVSPETISRYKAQPEFQELTRLLLQESVDATRLGIASLCIESVDHLRGLIRSFDDRTSLAAISLVLNRAAPVLGIIGTELRRPSEVERQ